MVSRSFLRSLPWSRCFLALGMIVTGASMGCDAINPAPRYQEAARQLRFSLDRVEPRIDLAFPPEQSRLRLQIDLGVDNPSDQRLRTRRVAGDLHLNAQGADHALGSVSFPEGADIAPKGRSVLRVEVTFSYSDLKGAWGHLSGAVLRHEPATWSLAGEARLDALGVEFGVPFRTSKESGR
jgi:LEA14-like dessication related protein